MLDQAGKGALLHCLRCLGTIFCVLDVTVHLYRPGQLAPALTALSPTVSQCLMACKDSN